MPKTMKAMNFNREKLSELEKIAQKSYWETGLSKKKLREFYRSRKSGVSDTWLTDSRLAYGQVRLKKTKKAAASAPMKAMKAMK